MDQCKQWACTGGSSRNVTAPCQGWCEVKWETHGSAPYWVGQNLREWGILKTHTLTESAISFQSAVRYENRHLAWNYSYRGETFLQTLPRQVPRTLWIKIRAFAWVQIDSTLPVKGQGSASDKSINAPWCKVTERVDLTSPPNIHLQELDLLGKVLRDIWMLTSWTWRSCNHGIWWGPLIYSYRSGEKMSCARAIDRDS